MTPELNVHDYAEYYRQLQVMVRAPRNACPSYIVDLLKTRTHRELIREAAEHTKMIVDLHDRIEVLERENAAMRKKTP